MNPYQSPSTTIPDASISLVAVGILTVGTIGLGFIAAVLCGFSCYLGIGGDSHDDLMAISLLYGVTFVAVASIGIPAGLIHLRRRSKLSQIPLAAYVVALAALVVASAWGNPIARWFFIFLVCCIMSVAFSIRIATRYQHVVGG